MFFLIAVTNTEDHLIITITFMHKVTNGEYLENISSLFVVKNNENYNLRNNNIDYKLEKPKTNFLKKSISYSGVKFGMNYQ